MMVVVDTSVFTSFYLGVLTNHDRVKSRTETPHFEILFCASYGMDRSQLEVYNENIRHGRWESKPYDKDDPFKKVRAVLLMTIELMIGQQRLLGLSWTYRLPRGMRPPSVLFEQPLCAEVMGAGFQKLPESDVCHDKTSCSNQG
jgi:DNA ligase-4